MQKGGDVWLAFGIIGLLLGFAGWYGLWKENKMIMLIGTLGMGLCAIISMGVFAGEEECTDLCDGLTGCSSEWGALSPSFLFFAGVWNVLRQTMGVACVDCACVLIDDALLSVCVGGGVGCCCLCLRSVSACGVYECTVHVFLRAPFFWFVSFCFFGAI